MMGDGQQPALAFLSPPSSQRRFRLLPKRGGFGGGQRSTSNRARETTTRSASFRRYNAVVSDVAANDPGPTHHHSSVHQSPETAAATSTATSIDLREAAGEDEEAVPTNLQDAVRTFFFNTKYLGPPIAALAIVYLSAWRVELLAQHGPSLAGDGLAFAGAVLFWSFQEHWMHGKLLHSDFDWLGKRIHEGHHRRPYHHVSIDPAWLMLGWLFAAHVLIRAVLPLPVALTATVGYSCAGLFYEWTHFIVHTKVRFRRNSYWQQLKNHQ